MSYPGELFTAVLVFQCFFAGYSSWPYYIMYELSLAMVIMSIIAILGYYGPYGHGHWFSSHGHDEYPTKEY